MMVRCNAVHLCACEHAVVVVVVVVVSRAAQLLLLLRLLQLLLLLQPTSEGWHCGAGSLCSTAVAASVCGKDATLH